MFDSVGAYCKYEGISYYGWKIEIDKHYGPVEFIDFLWLPGVTKTQIAIPWWLILTCSAGATILLWRFTRSPKRISG